MGMRKTELLDKYAWDGDSRLLLARVLDQWQRAEQRGVPTHTGFLSPAEQAVSADLLMAAAPGQGILAGGYPDAERRLWAFLPDWLEEETWQQGEECPLCALEVETPPGAGLTHRDYLGSLMGLGLTREKLGDILLSQQGAQVVVLREVLPILLSQWEKVGRYPVRLTPIEYKLLCLLAKNTGKVLTHNYILSQVWGNSTASDTPSLRVFMATLRKKLETDPSHPQYIQTHIGVGYRMLRQKETPDAS